MKPVFAYVISFFAFCTAAAAPVLAQQSTAQTRGASDVERFEAMLSFIRNRNARDYAISSPPGIDDGRYVKIGGIEQWITIRGQDRSNPVLLFLHGGPGDATNPWGYAAFRSWLKRFTVVQWDQRGAGRTLGRNGVSSADSMTLERMVRDGIELTEYLRTSLQKERVILVGHSWGSILGVFIVRARPELYWAFVGTGQVADPQRNYVVAYNALQAKAETLGEQSAVRELQEVGPPPYSDGRGYGIQRKWSNLFEGSDFFISSMFGLALGAPGSSLRDINDWTQGQLLSSQRLVPQTAQLDSKALGGEFSLPMFVFQGAEDFTTPTSLAAEFVDSIRAPRKRFVSIAEGGHFAVFMKSDAFLIELVRHVLPLVPAVGPK